MASRGGPKGPEALADDPKLFVGAIAQAGEDIRRTIDLLASRPEINPQRIGITGISLGGIIAATAAGAEPRLYRAGLILAGGDLLTIIHHARETRPLSEMLQTASAVGTGGGRSEHRGGRSAAVRAALRDRAQQGHVLMINAGRGRSDSAGIAPRSSLRPWESPIAWFGSTGWGITRPWPNCPGAADDGRFLRPGFAGRMKKTATGEH